MGMLTGPLACGSGGVDLTPGTPPRPVVVNVPNWVTTTATGDDLIDSIRYDRCFEVSYFVVRVSATGQLTDTAAALDAGRLLTTAHARGARVSFSVGGGTQSVSDIESAIRAHPDDTVSSIATYLGQSGYDGVKLDVENTSQISADEMLGFIEKLRTALPGKLVTLDLQPYQVNHPLWAKLDQMAPLIDGAYVMIYDFPLTPTKLEAVQTKMAPWMAKVGGGIEKLFPGVAITGSTNEDYSAADVAAVAGWARAEGLGGVMVWEATHLTPDYWAALAP